MDTEYVDGVYNKDGSQAIRPLNESEVKWLDKFYKENLNASFVKNDSNFELLSKEDRKELKTRIKFFVNKIKEIQKNINKLTLEKRDLIEDMNKLIDSDIQGKIYSENNSRNRCIFNMLQKNNLLKEFNVNEYNSYTVDRLGNIDWEELIINSTDLDLSDDS